MFKFKMNLNVTVWTLDQSNATQPLSIHGS